MARSASAHLAASADRRHSLEAATLQDVIAELEIATVSERQGRAIDRDQSGSMEKKKREGYF